MKVIPIMSVNARPNYTAGCGDCSGGKYCCDTSTKKVATYVDDSKKQEMQTQTHHITDGASKLYDSREGPKQKANYDNQAALPTQSQNPPYQEAPKNTIAPKSTPTPSRTVYVSPSSAKPSSPKIEGNSTGYNVNIASIADKVAYQSKPKELYSAKPSEPKAEPKQDQSLFSTFKAYATAVGAALTLAIAAPAMGSTQAPYNKLEQAVSHAKIEGQRVSTIDNYVNMHTQAKTIIQPASISQPSSEQAVRAPKQSVSLEQTATIAYQRATSMKASTQTDAYRLLPLLFGSRKDHQEREAIEQEPKQDYAKNYSSEQKVYRSMETEVKTSSVGKKTAKRAEEEDVPKKSAEPKPEGLVAKQTKQRAKQLPKKEPSLARAMAMDKGRAQIALAAEKLQMPPMLALSGVFR
jgi:hypothetical protein